MVNALLARLGLRLQRTTTAEQLVRRSRVATELVAAMARGPDSPARAEGVIFSMDRAMQLRALLASYARNVRSAPPLHLLYRATSAGHAGAYEDVLDEFGALLKSVTRQPARETFRDQLLGILRSMDAGRVFFLVDDIVFIEPFDFAEVLRVDARQAIVSLRLGANLRYSYVVRKEQQLPPLNEWPESPNLLAWRWTAGQHDWAYPLSVDGNVFATEEMRVLAENAQFDSPNTFEGGLQEFADFYLPRLGVCYRKSRLVNIPWNKVQGDNANFHGEVHQDDLLREWQAGRRIDDEALQGYANASVHEELPLGLRARGGA